MKLVLLAAAGGAIFLYWQGSKVAPAGSDVGTVFQAGLASLHWPAPHAAGKKPCCSGCAGAAAGAQPAAAPQTIELVPQ